MGPAIGAVLPLAIGIAISPIPIIAAILMLLSPKAKVTGGGFLLGWVVGIALAVTVFTLLSSVLLESDADEPKPVTGVIQIALGVLLLLLAVRQWRSRPKHGAEPAMPKWMQAIDKVSFWGALGLGLLLSAVNPKNLLLAVSAGVSIGSEQLDGGSIAAVIAVFVVLAASTILIPVVGYLVASKALRGPLDALHSWLARENAVIMAVLLVVIGFAVIGKGIAHF